MNKKALPYARHTCATRCAHTPPQRSSPRHSARTARPHTRRPHRSHHFAAPSPRAASERARPALHTPVTQAMSSWCCKHELAHMPRTHLRRARTTQNSSGRLHATRQPRPPPRHDRHSPPSCTHPMHLLALALHCYLRPAQAECETSLETHPKHRSEHHSEHHSEQSLSL